MQVVIADIRAATDLLGIAEFTLVMVADVGATNVVDLRLAAFCLLL
ncbi:hypothetical protein LOY55_12615 [Pseudomonas sp. B21-040]|jgi:hypothetical protein|nr:MULTISPECIES: hypothetical protein [unclassified Pseudomonas]UVL42886.1 hypothetical protein LOY55_12615 [Pseudomonas sp. B21-040]